MREISQIYNFNALLVAVIIMILEFYWYLKEISDHLENNQDLQHKKAIKNLILIKF